MDSIEVGGRAREYLLYAPEGESPDQGWPLVLVIHGLGSNAAEMRALTQFDEVAEREGFVAVYPEGLSRAWLDAGIGQIFGDLDIATLNLDFIEALIDELDGQIGIDPERVYMTGHSNGGMFAFHAACSMSEEIAAVALVAAASISQSFNGCEPEEPVSYIAFHGTEDNVVPYSGGPIVTGVDELGAYQSAHEAAKFWAKVNGCAPEPSEAELPDVMQADASTAVRETWPECAEGTSVALVTLEGGGHTWPGHSPAGSGLRATNLDIDATEMIWEFFETHPKAG